MSATVVWRETRRRWSVVLAVLVVLVAIPFVVRALPARAESVSPATLAGRIAASAGRPYQGYAVTTGLAGLPSLPRLDDVTALFDTNMSLRIWYDSPTQWRVDAIDSAGERDLYQAPADQVLWDYEQRQVTLIAGSAPVRLPRAADLAPPDLARRMLSAGSTGSTRTALPAKRIAGMDAAGLRLTPTDTATTVAHVDIWADPASGLPLEVDITARGATRPVLTSRLLDVTLSVPPAAITTYGQPPAGAGYTITTNPDIANALRNLNLARLPRVLDGLPRAGVGGLGVPGLGVYGTGFRQVVAANLPRRTGYDAFQAAHDVGGVSVEFPGGDGIRVGTPLFTVLILHSNATGNMFILVGLVDADVLNAAAQDLAAFEETYR
jgi:hypothetical protein